MGELMQLASSAMSLANAGKWWALVAVLMGAAIRMLKPDVRWVPNLDARWRPVALAMLGLLASACEMIATSNDWRAALTWGMSAAGTALLGHIFGIEVMRGGKELPIPGASPPSGPSSGDSKPMFPEDRPAPGPYGGAPMIGLAMAIAGCGAGAAPEAKSAAEAVAIKGLQSAEVSCEQKVLEVVGAAKTCADAARGLEELALHDPTCSGFMGVDGWANFCRGGYR